MQEGEKHLRFFKKSFGRLADFRYMYYENGISVKLPLPNRYFPEKILDRGGGMCIIRIEKVTFVPFIPKRGGSDEAARRNRVTPVIRF